jgi:hypothetical protein
MGRLRHRGRTEPAPAGACSVRRSLGVRPSALRNRRPLVVRAPSLRRRAGRCMELARPRVPCTNRLAVMGGSDFPAVRTSSRSRAGRERALRTDSKHRWVCRISSGSCCPRRRDTLTVAGDPLKLVPWRKQNPIAAASWGSSRAAAVGPAENATPADCRTALTARRSATNGPVLARRRLASRPCHPLVKLDVPDR